MNSFTIYAVGNISTDLELEGEGDKVRVQVPLIGNDYAGTDEDGKALERTTQLYFTAFGAKAKAIAKHCRKGDQLIVHGRIQANNYTQGERKVHAYNFIIEDFRFGAPGRVKREELSGA